MVFVFTALARVEHDVDESDSVVNILDSVVHVPDSVADAPDSFSASMLNSNNPHMTAASRHTASRQSCKPARRRK